MKISFKNLKLPKMQKIFFSENQINILKECKVANAEDNFQWATKNVVLPVIIIVIPLFIQLFFPTDVKDFKTLIFNGSISLIGINILFGMSTYLIKVNRTEKSKPKGTQDGQGNVSDEKENDKLSQDVVNLRGRLDDYKNILVFVGGIFYVIQALYGNYNSNTLFYTFLGFTVLVLIFSILIGRYMFIIKDDFFDKTFYGDLNESVIQARTRWAKKY